MRGLKPCEHLFTSAAISKEGRVSGTSTYRENFSNGWGEGERVHGNEGWRT